jgi:hypothetical protein
MDIFTKCSGFFCAKSTITVLPGTTSQSETGVMFPWRGLTSSGWFVMALSSEFYELTVFRGAPLVKQSQHTEIGTNPFVTYIRAIQENYPDFDAISLTI